MSQHDFDFLHGDWQIHNRRLRARLESSQDWEEFETFAHIRPVLGGLGNVEEISLAGGEPLGLTLRAFNLDTRQWQIQWVGARDGAMQPPMIGSFEKQEGGAQADEAQLGTFFGDDHWQGRPCRCRFLWRLLDAGQATWEQALSVDAGQNWETNWTMAFRRQSDQG